MHVQVEKHMFSGPTDLSSDESDEDEEDDMPPMARAASQQAAEPRVPDEEEDSEEDREDTSPSVTSGRSSCSPRTRRSSVWFIRWWRGDGSEEEDAGEEEASEGCSELGDCPGEGHWAKKGGCG